MQTQESSWSGYCGRKQSVPMIEILLSSSVGMSIEWLTGVSQVLGSRPDMFSCELKIHKKKINNNNNGREWKATGERIWKKEKKKKKKKKITEWREGGREGGDGGQKESGRGWEKEIL